MDSIDPRPEQVTGLQRAKPYAHNRVLPKYHKDMVISKTHIGFFPKGSVLRDSTPEYKHIVPLYPLGDLPIR